MFERALIIGVGKNCFNATEVWKLLAEEGNLHVEVSGNYFVVTSEIDVCLIRVYNKLTNKKDRRKQYLRPGATILVRPDIH